MQKLVGKIEHKKVSPDSQSKTREWFLIVPDNGESKQIRLQGENPFEQPTLRGLVGKRCEASGVYHNDLFLAKTIKEINKKTRRK